MIPPDLPRLVAEAELASARKILNEETNRAERAEAELAAERARMDWLDENAGDIHRYNSNRYIFTFNQDLRTAIDAAMKDGA